MVKIECDGIERRYGDVQALRGLSLVLEGGELMVVLGPSGAGKSTLLNVVAGLDVPDAGTIRFNDRLVNSPRIEVTPMDRKVGMVFQRLGLWPHLTVRQHLRFVLGRQVGRRDKTQARIEEALSMLEIEALGDRYPRQLSGGEQQRLALARALVTEPEILLLDEPLGSLDTPLRERLVRVIRRLHEERRLTTLYVTHDRAEAFDLADRLAVMNDGKIVQVDTPDRLWHSPADSFVADLLGAGYAIEAEFVRPGMVRTILGEVHVNGGCMTGETRLLVGLDDLRLSDAAQDAQGTVVRSIFRSGAWVAEVDIGGQIVGVRNDGRLEAKSAVRVKLCGVPRLIPSGKKASH